MSVMMVVFTLVMMLMFMLVVVILVVVFVFMSMFVIVVMFMHVLIFFNTIHNNVCMCTFNTALDALFEIICDTGNTQRIELIFTRFYAASKLGKRCEEHVACCAHIAFDIKSLHGLTSDVVDHAGRISCTESVVDIYDGNAART